MQIHGHERRSQLALCVASANKFLLTADEAIAIMKRQIAVVRSHWDDVCEEAQLDDADRRMLRGRQFLNDLAFEGMETPLGDVIGGLPRT